MNVAEFGHVRLFEKDECRCPHCVQKYWTLLNDIEATLKQFDDEWLWEEGLDLLHTLHDCTAVTAVVPAIVDRSGSSESLV